jgi:RimJ/RimL family protein N-acetyltransferase
VDEPRASGGRSTDDWLVKASDRRASWRFTSPVLRGAGVTLREVQLEDAAALVALLNDPHVSQVLSSVPTSPAEFTARIEAAGVERLEGRGVCLAVVPDHGTAVGLFRIREIEPGFGSAEWEFAIAHEHWGGGLFFRVAPIVVDFVFDVLGANRLEARAALPNGRGHGALRKLGAVQEAVLRQSVHHHGEVYHDQALWTLFADEWRARTGRGRAIH